MPKFLLLLRHDPAVFQNYSPEEMQAVMLRYRRWREDLSARVREPGGHKLRDNSGKLMKPVGGKLVVTDGPFTETREVLGGFFQFEAAGYEQAVEVARDCPHLDFGTIEIREIEV